MIKCFIFDQDGTLYSNKSELIAAIKERTNSWLMYKLNKSKEENIYYTLKQKNPNIIEGITSLGYTVEEYHREVFDKIDPKKYLMKDEELIKILNRLNSQIYTVTFGSYKYSKELQLALGISHFIKKTYCVEDNTVNYSKKFFYELIAKEEGLKFSEICVVGDNYYIDIAPAIELGCISVHISDKEVAGPNFTIQNIYELPKVLDILNIDYK